MWIKRSFEVRLHDASKMDLLNENFILGELGFIIIRYLRDNQVNLSPDNEMNIYKQLKNTMNDFQARLSLLGHLKKH